MEKIFGIVPASQGPYIFIWALSLFLVAVIALFVFIGYSSRHVSFAVSEDGLRIRGALYGRSIPRSDIVSGDAKVVNLNTDAEYKPKSRTNGIGLPGYAEGWFRLANKQKALVFVTDRSRVVYVPTHQNYAVLLSVREADELADLIKRWE